MGKRRALFQSARECINVLECPKPNEILYEHEFGLCMLYIVRQKLIHFAHKIINDIYKRNECIKSDLLRYYKLNKLHTFQLIKYNKLMNSLQQITHINVNVNTQYLRDLSYMITMCSKCVKKM